jgi:quercetin dioxygenase-like cupin family protein
MAAFLLSKGQRQRVRRTIVQTRRLYNGARHGGWWGITQGKIAMKITAAADLIVKPASADWFTGDVTMSPLFHDEAPSHAAGARVMFQPGARTNWHTHPLGQILIVTEGEGRVQREGGPVQVIRTGDVVRFDPGERHWHGAAPGLAMTHIAIHEAVDGSAVTWAEPVAEADYLS